MGKGEAAEKKKMGGLDMGDHADQRGLLDRTSLLMENARVKKENACPLITSAIFVPTDTTSSAAARIADRQQHLLEILEFIQ